MDILKAILKIEKKAQEISDGFEEIKAEENKKTETILKELKTNAEIEYKNKVTKLSKDITDSLNSELEKNHTDSEKKLCDMEKYFSDNENLWISEITENIIKGDIK